MLNRELMKKTITDLKNNKEFLKKERKIERYEKWINAGREELFHLSSIPTAIAIIGGPLGFAAYGAVHPENEVAAIGTATCMGAALAMVVGSAFANTYCVGELPVKQEKLKDELNNTIKHNYVKNGILEYYQNQGLTENEAQDKFSKFCKTELVNGPDTNCEYSYDQYDKDMEKYINQNNGFDYNDFVVLDDTTEMAE